MSQFKFRCCCFPSWALSPGLLEQKIHASFSYPESHTRIIQQHKHPSSFLTHTTSITSTVTPVTMSIYRYFHSSCQQPSQMFFFLPAPSLDTHFPFWFLSKHNQLKNYKHSKLSGFCACCKHCIRKNVPMTLSSPTPSSIIVPFFNTTLLFVPYPTQGWC